MGLDAKLGRSFGEDVGIPIAAGFIVGEALVGIGDAITQVAASMMGGGS